MKLDPMIPLHYQIEQPQGSSFKSQREPSSMSLWICATVPRASVSATHSRTQRL
jgi:hypothetical protein